MPQRQAVDGTLSVDNASFAPPCDRQRLVAKMLLSHDMRYTATGITERDDRCGTRPSGELRSPTPAAAATALRSRLHTDSDACGIQPNFLTKFYNCVVPCSMALGWPGARSGRRYGPQSGSPSSPHVTREDAGIYSGLCSLRPAFARAPGMCGNWGEILWATHSEVFTLHAQRTARKTTTRTDRACHPRLRQNRCSQSLRPHFPRC